jgi:hypothetical protein
MAVRRKSLSAALLLTLALAGCSNETSSMSSPSPSGDGQDSSGSLSALANPDVPIFNLGAGDTSSDGRGPCVFDPESGQFVCPDRSRDGITFTLRYTLYDANGNVQSRFDRATTASIRTETTASGTTTRENATSTIDRSGVMTTSGLGIGATTHTLNGTERGTVVTTASGQDGLKVTSHTTIQDSTTDLVVPVGSKDRVRGPGYPLSGVRVHETVTTSSKNGGEARTVTTRRKETFNGTNIVQVEITVNGVTQHCTFDLDTRQSTCDRK